MEQLRVIVDVNGRRIEPMMEPKSFVIGADPSTAIAEFDCFPMDPSVVERIEIVNGERWIATAMSVSIGADRRIAKFHLKRIVADD